MLAEARHGRRKQGTGGIGEKVGPVKRKFSRNHAMAIHSNAIAMVATVWYGFALGLKITIDVTKTGAGAL